MSQQDRILREGLSPGGRFELWQGSRPRYVVADVDGTLILRGTTATPVVVDAVRAALDAGLDVGFATGRLPAGLADLYGQLRPPGPHIVHNGAQVRARGRSLRIWPLQPVHVRRLAALCNDNGWYGEFYVDEGFVVTDRREAARPHWERVTSEPQGLLTEIDVDAAAVIKATVVAFDAEDVPLMTEQISALGLVPGPATSPLTPDMTFINVTAPEADKGRALAFAAEWLGCSLAEVVAVGDGLNDLSMLEVVGTAIAMGQAPQAVRDVAHLTVPEVEADGVAHALRAVVEWVQAVEEGGAQRGAG